MGLKVNCWVETVHVETAIYDLIHLSAPLHKISQALHGNQPGVLIAEETQLNLVRSTDTIKC